MSTFYARGPLSGSCFIPQDRPYFNAYARTRGSALHRRCRHTLHSGPVNRIRISASPGADTPPRTRLKREDHKMEFRFSRRKMMQSVGGAALAQSLATAE